MERHANCECKVCGEKMYRRPIQIASGSVYCSSTCCGKDQQMAHTCSVCKQNYLGAKRTCSRACSNRARSGLRYDTQRLNDRARIGTILKEKVARQNGGVCARCGLNNFAILQVHHIKERYRGGSDDLSNLELLCPNCHMTHHLGTRLFSK